MEDIIDIIVTETTNLIEITSQPTDEVIDVNIIDNREDITLNVTPSVVEININSLTGNFGVNWGDIDGTLSNQTDLQDALDLKADLVDGKVPSSQLPSYVDDIIEVATYSALPATGETGKIYVVLDTNLIYRWSGSAYIEIKDSSAVWGAITGTLSSQTDLQNALNAKVPYTGASGNVNLGEYGATVGYLGFDTTPSGTPTGIGTMYWDSANRTVSLIDGDGDTTLQLGQEERVLVHNNTGSTLTDGQVVYVTGSTGGLPSVALAVNTSDSTSSVTFGIVTESIAHGADGFITTSGIVHGLNTNAFTEGSALWLGSTAGTFTETKPVAPAHAVLVGYVIKKSGGNGSIFVKIQNGYELDEIHDVAISSVANNDGIFYESSTSLWKNKSIATVLGYTPVQGTGDTGYYARWTSAGVLSDGFIQTTSNITYVEGMGLSTLNGLDITGNYGAGGGGLKIRSYDETTGNAYIDFANTGGRFYLGVNRSTASGLMTNATAYATVLTTGLGTTNLEFGTNATKRLTLDGTSGAATFTSSVTASALYVTGMTAGSGAIYHTASRLTFANYNASGTLHFEVNGGVGALTLNSDKSATFEAGGSFANDLTITGTSTGLKVYNDIKVYNTVNFTDSSYNNLARIYSTGNTLYLQTNNSGVYKGITIDNTGALIGASSITATSTSAYSGEALRLQTKNDSSSYYMTMYPTDAGASGITWTFRHANAAAVYDTMTFSQGKVGIGTTSPGSYNADFSNLVIANTSSFAGMTIATASNSYGTIAFADGTSGIQKYAGYIQYSHTDDAMAFASNATERMRITSSGNVGIGTTSPISIPYGQSLTIGDSSTQNQPYLMFARNSTGGYWGGIRWYNGSTLQSSIQEDSSANLLISTSNSERMRITSGGNLLVGTTSEAGDAKLVVSGRTYTEGVYIATGSFSLGGGSTGTFFTFGNSATNRVFLITVRQQGSGVNSVIGVCTTFSTGATAYNVGQDNTNPAVQLTLSTSGLGLRLTTGAGYGTTTWEYTITQIK